MLYILATPIGNLDDVSVRFLRTIELLDVLLCEDTRVTAALLSKLKVKNRPRLVSFYDEVESKKLPEVMNYLEQSLNVGLVSDAGVPLISDPGWLLVRKCYERNLEYTFVPGPSSVISSLVLSGLPISRFAFLGYLPKRSGDRRKILGKYNISGTTYVCLETANRINESISDILGIHPDAEVRVCREMTKANETVFDGRDLPIKTKGELVITFYF